MIKYDFSCYKSAINALNAVKRILPYAQAYVSNETGVWQLVLDYDRSIKIQTECYTNA